MIVGHPTSCLLWMVSHNPTCSRKGCWSVNPLILVILLWTSGRGPWIVGHLILIYIHKSATANAPLTINGVPSLPGGPWSHIRHTPFLDTCFLIFLAMLFAACLASDFVPTLYELKLWPGLTIPPLLVTCVMPMMYRMSDISFSTAPIHTWSLREALRRTYASLFPSAGFNNVSAFLGQENNKLFFFLHALIVFYEQASSRSIWLKAFFL